MKSPAKVIPLNTNTNLQPVSKSRARRGTKPATVYLANLKNFKIMIALCREIGQPYNPGNPCISITNLDAIAGNSERLFQTLHDKLSAIKQEFALGDELFVKLTRLNKEIIHALQSAPVSTYTMRVARRFATRNGRKRARDIRSKLMFEMPPEMNIRHAVLHALYERRILLFEMLINLLQKQPGYHPTAPELSISALFQFLDRLRELNAAAISNHQALEKLNDERNKWMFMTSNYLFETTRIIKKTVKLDFGAKSIEYNSLKKIKFVRPANKIQ